MHVRLHIPTNHLNLTFDRNGVDGYNKTAVNLVDEHTTPPKSLRQHVASKHKVIEIFSYSYFVLILKFCTTRVSIGVGA